MRIDAKRKNKDSHDMAFTYTVFAADQDEAGAQLVENSKKKIEQATKEYQAKKVNNPQE